MDIVIILHSLARYLVLIAAILGLSKAVVSLVQKSASDNVDRILASVFLGIFDLQAVIGMLIILLGGLRGPLHPLMMFIALAIAHWLNTTVKRSNDSTVYLLRIALYIAPLGIILFGLLILGQL